MYVSSVSKSLCSLCIHPREESQPDFEPGLETTLEAMDTGVCEQSGNGDNSKRSVPESAEKISPYKKIAKPDHAAHVHVSEPMPPQPRVAAPVSESMPVAPPQPPLKALVSEPEPLPVGAAPPQAYVSEPQPVALPPIEPASEVKRCLNFGGEMSGGPATGLDPEPAAAPAVPNTVKNPEMDLLRMAMDRISALEKQLQDQSHQSLITPPGTKRTSAEEPSSAEHTCRTVLETRSSSLTTEGRREEEEEEEERKPSDAELMRFPNGTRAISHDALRMRLRRMCETKASGKSHVDAATREQYKNGGEDREWLEIALVETLQKVGVDNKHHKKIRVAQPN